MTTLLLVLIVLFVFLFGAGTAYGLYQLFILMDDILTRLRIQEDIMKKHEAHS